MHTRLHDDGSVGVSIVSIVAIVHQLCRWDGTVIRQFAVERDQRRVDIFGEGEKNAIERVQ